MSTSAAHAAAARQNGCLSKGPVTAEGRARSSQNARKHNLFTATPLLPSEDREQLEALLAAFTAEFKPVTAVELRCVREMADAEFRLQRVRNHAMEIQWKAMQDFPGSDIAAAEAFEKLANDGKSLQLLDRYERQFQRQFSTALKTLLDLRKARLNSAETMEKLYMAARLRHVQDIIDAPTPGEVYGYGQGLEDAAMAERQAALQNEPISPQAHAAGCQ